MTSPSIPELELFTYRVNRSPEVDGVLDERIDVADLIERIAAQWRVRLPGMADTENPQTPTDALFSDREDVQAALGRIAGDHKTPAPSAHEYLGRVFGILDESNDPDEVAENIQKLREQFLTELAASEGVVAP